MPLTKIHTDDILSGSISAGSIGPDIVTGQSASTSADDNDLILIYDDTTSALRKMTRANFTSGLGGSLDVAYNAGSVITADTGPVEIQDTSNTNAVTTLLKLAVSGSVTGGGAAGPEIQFTIPVSGGSKIGSAIRGVKFASSTSDSTGEMQFLCSDNDETLDLRLKMDGTGIAVQGAGSTLAYPSSGDSFIVASSGNDYSIAVTNSNGNVGIGNRSAAELLEVEDGTGATTIQINNTATSGDPQLAFALSGTKKFTMGVDDSDSDKFKIGTTAVATSTRLTIDSSGNVGIGETSPSYNLHISSTGDAALYLEADTNNTPEDDNAFIKLSQDNTAVQSIIGLCGATNKDPENVTYTGVVNNNMLIGTTTNYGLQLGTNDNVRMTIENSGYVGIGDTSPSYPLSLSNSNSAGYVAQFYNSYNGSAGGLWVKAGNTSSTGSPHPLIVQSYSGTNQFYVRQDGKYYHRGSSVSTADSKRDIIALSENAVNMLKNIRVVTYNYIEDTNDRVARIGFIADDTDNQLAIDSRLTDGGTGFDVQTIVGTLIKAIQELNQRIETLESGS